jgi:hypothetical protein
VGDNSIAAGFHEGVCVLDERRIMLGSMPGKGYKMVAGGQDTGLPTFPVGEAAFATVVKWPPGSSVNFAKSSSRAISRAPTAKSASERSAVISSAPCRA